MDKFIRKINTSPKPKHKYSPSRSKVFGVPLKLLLDSQSAYHIPAIVTNLCQCLLKHGTEVEGIFRINGSARLIELFKRDLEFSPSSDLCPTENVEIYALAGVLKLFLRELPGGVVPEEYTLKLIKAIRGDGEDPLECLQRLQELIPSLPRENRRLLHYLCRFLHKIAENEALNKMSCQGLGILFGPCIFRFDVRSQGLRNQGLVNQAMTVLIEYCDTIFRPDHMDETFALGDDLADSWRSATSGLGSESFELKARSMTCSSTSANRSFYSTLFSGRSHDERLTTESAGLLPRVDPPTLFSSSEYQTVKPLHPVPWPTLSSSLLSSHSDWAAQLKRESTSLTFNSALSNDPAPQTASDPQLTAEDLLFGSNHRRVTNIATTTTTISSPSSHTDSSSDLNAQSITSGSPKSTHSEARVSQSEPTSNLLNDFHLPDSSNQLALDLAHLLTSFGSSNGLDFPVRSHPDGNLFSGYEHVMLPHCESDVLHTTCANQAQDEENRSTQTTKKILGTSTVLQQPHHHQQQQQPLISPPLLVVSQPTTCGDHEPVVQGEPHFATVCDSDYEGALYELASTLHDSSTTATTSARTITISSKMPTDYRVDELSEVDAIGQDSRSLIPDSCETRLSAWPGTETTMTTTTTTTTCSATAPLTHWSQVINACLDAHVFAAGSVQESTEKPLRRQRSLSHLFSASNPPTRAQSGSVHRQMRRTNRSLTDSLSAFPTVSGASRLTYRPSSPDCVTSANERRLADLKVVTKRHTTLSAPGSPNGSRRAGTGGSTTRKPALGRSVDSVARVSATAQSKSLLSPVISLSNRPSSAPLIALPSSSEEVNSSGASPKRKHGTKLSGAIKGLSPDPVGCARRNRWSAKRLLGQSCGSLDVSASAPPSLTPTPPHGCTTPTSSITRPRSLLRPSSSCSQLPRACDRKRETSGAHRRRGRGLLAGTKFGLTGFGGGGGGGSGELRTRRRVPLLQRSHSFHYLPPRIKGPHLFVIPKSVSFGCLRGSMRHRLQRSRKSSQSSRKSKRSDRARQEEPSTAVGERLDAERQIHRALNGSGCVESISHGMADTELGASPAEPITGASLQAFCELLTAVLDEQRRCCGRPNGLTEMNAEQIFQEKIDLQKGLLYFERLHGRPTDSESKKIMKPLYERYRQVKRLLRSTDLGGCTERDTSVLNCFESTEASVQLTPQSNSISPCLIPTGSPMDSRLAVPVTSTAQISRVGVAHPEETLSPLSLRSAKRPTSSLSERDDSRVSDIRLFDSTVSHRLRSPRAESKSYCSPVQLFETVVNQEGGPINPLMSSSGPQGEHVMPHHRTIRLPDLGQEELIAEWKLILGKKRALQHELREFETTIEQVKGRPPDKIDRRPMRDKYHEYRSLKRTLEALTSRLKLEPTLMCVSSAAPSDQRRRVAHSTPEPDAATHASSSSAIRTP